MDNKINVEVTQETQLLITKLQVEAMEIEFNISKFESRDFPSIYELKEAYQELAKVNNLINTIKGRFDKLVKQEQARIAAKEKAEFEKKKAELEEKAKELETKGPKVKGPKVEEIKNDEKSLKPIEKTK